MLLNFKTFIYVLFVCASLISFLQDNIAWGNQPIGWCTSMNPHVDADSLKIYEFNPEPIGKGATSSIYQGSVRLPDGTIQKVAFKSTLAALQGKLEANEKLLKPILKSADARHFNKIFGSNLKCTVNTGVKGESIQIERVVVLNLAQGSTNSLIPNLKLDPQEALKNPKEFERKLGIIEKFAQNGGQTLDALKKHDLIHSDIKPENILYSNQGGKGISEITANDIEFELADYDFMVKKGSHVNGITKEFASPEVNISSIATHEQDIYSYSSSVYNMMAGESPIQSARNNSKFYESHMTEKVHGQVTSKVNEYFDQYSELKAKNPELYQRVHRLQNVVETGMNHSPAERTKIYEVLNQPVSDFKIQNQIKGTASLINSEIPLKDTDCEQVLEEIGTM
jgi:serine/threonine protein kinase